MMLLLLMLMLMLLLMLLMLLLLMLLLYCYCCCGPKVADLYYRNRAMQVRSSGKDTYDSTSLRLRSRSPYN